MIVSTLEEDFSNLIKKSLKKYFDDLKGENPATSYYVDIIHLVEKPLIEETLLKVDFNQKKAACLLGINRNTLSKKIKELKISIQRKNVHS
jgi:DNA-binding protein Fis